MQDMASKSISSLTRKTWENPSEESHDEDKGNLIRPDEPYNDLDKALLKIISKTRKDLVQEQLEKLKAVVFDLEDFWRKSRDRDGRAKVTPHSQWSSSVVIVPNPDMKGNV